MIYQGSLASREPQNPDLVVEDPQLVPGIPFRPRFDNSLIYIAL